MLWKSKTSIAFITILFAQFRIWANPPIIPIFDVVVTPSNEFCGSKMRALILPPEPYQDFRPAPFRYRQDVQHDGAHAFVIGGVNSDEVLQNMTHLTGVPMDILQDRGSVE